MFVIPCKYSDKSPIVQCVASIRKHYPDDLIAVVDSDSDDKSYFESLEKYGVVIEDIQNKNFLEGALWHCFEKYPDEEFIYLIQDSMKIKMNFDYVEDVDFTCIASFPNTCWAENFEGGSAAQINFSKNALEKTNYEYLGPEVDWHPVFGISFFISRPLLQTLKDNGMDKYLPTSKMEMEASERIWGMVLYQEGIDVKSACIMDTPIHTRPNPIISKIWLYRQ